MHRKRHDLPAVVRWAKAEGLGTPLSAVATGRNPTALPPATAKAVAGGSVFDTGNGQYVPTLDAFRAVLAGRLGEELVFDEADAGRQKVDET